MKTLPTIAILVAFLQVACATPPSQKPTPEFSPWGFDLTGQDKSADPGDSFFRYANGRWFDRTPIPPDKVSVWIDTPADERIESRLHHLLSQAASRVSHEPTDLESKAGAYFKSFMDEARVERLGAGAIQAELAAIKSARSADDVAGLTGRALLDFDNVYFDVSQHIDHRDPTHYAVYVAQGGLGLPDRDYYLKVDFAETRAQYQQYVRHLLELIDWPDPTRASQHVVDFETAVAEASWTKTQQRDPVATYNAMSVDALEQFAPGFAWRAFLTEARLPQVTRVVVAEKAAFPTLASVWHTTSLDIQKAWLAFHVADNAAPYLSATFANSYFAFHGKILAGQEQQADRWKRGVLAVAGGDFLNADRFGGSGTMGFGVGKLYTKKYFGVDAKARVESLVTNLTTAFRGRVERLDWMAPATKAEALKKLGAYLVKVGYPDHPRDYSSLQILDDDLTGNVRRTQSYEWAYRSARLGGLVDRTEWLWTPQTNNSFNGDLIDIVFPAGSLHPPAFDPAADAAINYGAIGGVIGHELTHGFDDQGRKVDSTGALRDWWTQSDAVKFDQRAKRLSMQFSSYEPLPGMHVSGDLTLGESIADLGGLTIALDAYHASLGGKPASVIDGISGDQRVFLGWAQYWRNKRTEPALRKMIASNPHAPSQYRVDGIVRNLDAWYEAFGIRPNNRLFLAPEQRVRIW